MSKKYTILIILLAIPVASGLQTEKLDTFSIDKDIRTFEATEKGNFQLQITSRDSIYLFNKSGEQQFIDKAGYSAFTTDTRILNGTRYWLTGTKFPGSIVLFNESKVFLEQSLPYASDRQDITKNGKIFTMGALARTIIYDIEGNRLWNYQMDQSKEDLITTEEIDSDGRKEFFISGNKGRLSVRDSQGEQWHVSRDEKPSVKQISENKVLVAVSDYISIHNMSNGEEIWSSSEQIDSRRVLKYSNSFVYSSNGQIIERSVDGEVLKSFESGLESPYLLKMSGRDWIGAYENEKAVFFSKNGEKIGSINFEDIVWAPSITEYDNDGKMELAVRGDNDVRILDIERDVNVDNYSIENTVFVGNNRELLNAVAMNATVHVSGSVNEAGQLKEKKLGIGDVEGKSINSFDRIATRQEKFYADSREKQIYIAALASKRNATITFDRDEADRDFSNYTVEELQNIFIQEFEPNHVVVADLSSEKGLLAAYMAAQQGSLPLNWDQEASYPEDLSAEEINQYNGVIQLENKIEESFRKIGENRNTLFDGKYISLLNGPSKVKTDPAENGIIDDPKDGETFRTDLEYGNLDEDQLLEAGVGRYPSETSRASLVFHRSMNRDVGGKATVASEYLASSWPVILATGGGGLRYASRLESTFKQQGYDTTHLVEYRADPVSFLVSLTPVELTGFVNEVDTASAIIKQTVSAGAATAFENALIGIKVLNSVEQLMEMYYEFRWGTYEFDPDRGIDRIEELGIDPTSSKESNIQKSIMKAIYAFIWPERHPELNHTNLVAEMNNSDIIYYQGIGDSESWKLPKEENESGKMYSKNFKSDEIPELERTIVWDNSDLGGTRGSEMKQSFLKKGASSYLGFSTVNYAAYSSISGYNFFKKKKTLGNSLKHSINQLRTTGFIYSPKSTYRTGLREKMSSSLRMYGNPEMPKDPIQNKHFSIRRSCEGNICELKVDIDLPQKTVEVKNQTILSSNASSYVMQPGSYITPLYSTGFGINPETEILDIEKQVNTRRVESLKLPIYQPITHSGNFANASREKIDLKTSAVNRTDNKLIYTVSGVEDTDRVVENASMTVKYRSPVVMDLKSQNRNLSIDIHSDRKFDGKLFYRIRNTSYERKVSIDRGENKLNLNWLDYGINKVEVYLTDGKLVAEREKEIKVGRDLKTVAFSPDIRKGSTRSATVIVSNPNSFHVEEKLELDTGEGLALGMLEEKSKNISLAPDETKELNWRLLGLERGNSSLEVEKENISVQIDSSSSRTSLISPERALKQLQSPTSGIKVSTNATAKEVTWKTPRGKLKFVENPSYSKKKLSTQNYSVTWISGLGKEKKKVITSEGILVKTVENGLETWKGSLDKQVFKEKLKVLETEVEKIEGFMQQGS